MAARNQNPNLLTPEKLVKRWKGVVKLGTLKNWRSDGYGPRHTYLGIHPVYPIDEVVRYETSNKKYGQNRAGKRKPGRKRKHDA